MLHVPDVFGHRGSVSSGCGKLPAQVRYVDIGDTRATEPEVDEGRDECELIGTTWTLRVLKKHK
jgi:hypothetical protein